MLFCVGMYDDDKLFKFIYSEKDEAKDFYNKSREYNLKVIKDVNIGEGILTYSVIGLRREMPIALGFELTRNPKTTHKDFEKILNEIGASFDNNIKPSDDNAISKLSVLMMRYCLTSSLNKKLSMLDGSKIDEWNDDEVYFFSSDFSSKMENGGIHKDMFTTKSVPKNEIKVDNPTSLYLIKMNDYYKIGVSANPKMRLSQIQTSSPFEAVLEFSVEIPNKSLAYKVEKNLHRILKHRRLHNGGEWFYLSDEIVNSIKTIKELEGVHYSSFTSEPSFKWKTTNNGDFTPIWNVVNTRTKYMFVKKYHPDYEKRYIKQRYLTEDDIFNMFDEIVKST